MSSDSSSDRKHRRKRSNKQLKIRRRSHSSGSSSSHERRRRRRKKERKRRHFDDLSDEHGHKKKHKKSRRRDSADNRSVKTDLRADASNANSTEMVAPRVDKHQEAEASAPSQLKTTNQPTKPTSSKGPMTQAQYQALYSQIREVIDPHTGRTRWQRGTGEIVERIVSREEHKNLNTSATRGDGASFGRDIVKAALMK